MKVGLKNNKTKKGVFIEVHCFNCGRELEIEQLYKNYKKEKKHLVYVKACAFCLKQSFEKVRDILFAQIDKTFGLSKEDYYGIVLLALLDLSIKTHKEVGSYEKFLKGIPKSILEDFKVIIDNLKKGDK